jgi:hypothetical protein
MKPRSIDERTAAMETISNRDPVQHRSHSLIEFLLGDGIHPGWLDEQRHHRFGSIALRCPGYPGDQTERQSARSRGRGVWHSGGTPSKFGAM